MWELSHLARRRKHTCLIIVEHTNIWSQSGEQRAHFVIPKMLRPNRAQVALHLVLKRSVVDIPGHMTSDKKRERKTSDEEVKWNKKTQKGNWYSCQQVTQNYINSVQREHQLLLTTESQYAVNIYYCWSTTNVDLVYKSLMANTIGDPSLTKSKKRLYRNSILLSLAVMLMWGEFYKRTFFSFSSTVFLLPPWSRCDWISKKIRENITYLQKKKLSVSCN